MVLQNICKLFDTFAIKRQSLHSLLMNLGGSLRLSQYGKWQKWHGLTYTVSLERDVWLMLVSLEILTPTYKMPYYFETSMWLDEVGSPHRDRDAHETPLLFTAVWVFPTQKPDVQEKENTSWPQPQPPSNCNDIRNPKDCLAEWSPVGPHIGEQNILLLTL